MKLTDYIELVEWSGRQISNKKKGSITDKRVIDFLVMFLILTPLVVHYHHSWNK